MNNAEAMIDLENKGYFIWDDFLSLADLALVQKDYLSFRSDGKFNSAGIGKGSDFQVNKNIRSDETYWCDPSFLKTLDTLKNAINQHFFLGLWSFEGHYSYYPIGGIYQAHLDRFSKDDSRTISMVLFLNQNWKTLDGGELRIHQKDKTLLPVDITPIDGRLVCFFSADVLHEVLLTNQPRYGFAGWWKRR